MCQFKGVILYNMMICISSLDAHSVLCTFTVCFYWVNIVEGDPSLKQHLMSAEGRVSCRHYISMCEEQRTSITVIDGQ